MSTLQLVSKIRVFSIIHILLCISIVVAANFSANIFEILIKLWSVLLLFSGGMILLSTIFYLLSGALNKISVEGNILGVIYFAIGIVLYRYFEKSVIPMK